MYRFVWRITDPAIAGAEVARAAMHAALLRDLKVVRGPSPVFRELAAPLAQEVGGLQPADVGLPTEYFQAWIDDVSSPALSLRLAAGTSPIIGGIINKVPLPVFGGIISTQPTALVDFINAPPLRRVAAVLGDLVRRRRSSLGVAELGSTEGIGVADSVPWSLPPLTALLANAGGFCHESQPHLLPHQLFVNRQRYLADAADGVLAMGVLHAWTFEGGFGRDVNVVDVEDGYLDHETLGGRVIPIRPGKPNSHGAAVLSLVCGRPAKEGGRPVGIVGLAPEATPYFVCSYDQALSATPFFDPAWAVIEALESGHLRAGDVLLVEVNTRVNIAHHATLSNFIGPNYPIEAFGDGWLASRIAVKRGVHVVHAACNSGRVLEIDDSGAILVGALSPTGGQPPGFSSNSGKLVKLHAWGSCVASAGSRDFEYQDLHLNAVDEKCYTFFSGTSSAAALVAGAVASLSGILKANGLSASPAQMRRCLLAGGHRVPGADAHDPRRMLHLPRAIADLEQQLGVSFKRNELAVMTPSAILAKVVADGFGL